MGALAYPTVQRVSCAAIMKLVNHGCGPTGGWRASLLALTVRVFLCVAAGFPVLSPLRRAAQARAKYFLI